MIRKNLLYICGIIFLISSVSCTQKKKTTEAEAEFAGSSSCIECHENFYKLWSPSHHGKAMEPINLKYIQEENLPESEEFLLEGKIYSVTLQDSSMFMIEKDGEAIKKYKVAWALGGKNVSYYLTMLEKGKLQTNKF